MSKSHKQISRVRIMSKTEAAWLAGFFDGEGSICMSKVTNGHSSKKYTYWKLSIPNTSKLSLEKVVKITGIGRLYPQRKAKPHYKQQWKWQSHATDEVSDVCRQMLPYLTISEKIRRIKEVMS